MFLTKVAASKADVKKVVQAALDKAIEDATDKLSVKNLGVFGILKEDFKRKSKIKFKDNFLFVTLPMPEYARTFDNNAFSGATEKGRKLYKKHFDSLLHALKAQYKIEDSSMEESRGGMQFFFVSDAFNS